MKSLVIVYISFIVFLPNIIGITGFGKCKRGGIEPTSFTSKHCNESPCELYPGDVTESKMTFTARKCYDWNIFFKLFLNELLFQLMTQKSYNFMYR